MTYDPHQHQLETAIYQRLGPLHKAFHMAIESPYLIPPSQAENVARLLLQRLDSIEPYTRAKTAEVIVEICEPIYDSEVTWWASPLGKRVARVCGETALPALITPGVALALTSRATVPKSTRRDRMVDTGAVLAVLRASYADHPQEDTE